MEMVKTEHGELPKKMENNKSFNASSSLNMEQTDINSMSFNSGVQLLHKYKENKVYVDGCEKVLTSEDMFLKNGVDSTRQPNYCQTDQGGSGNEIDQQITEDSFNITDDTPSSQYNLKMLLDIYSKVEGHKCRFCDYAANERSTLKRHLLAIHLNIKNAKCQLCQYRTTTRFSLARHMSVVHLKLKKYECYLCPFRSAQKSQLEIHIHAIHLQLKNHKCHLCSYKTSGESHLKRHIRGVHLRLKRHACHLCDFRSTEVLTLKNHVNSVHYRLRNFKCEYCDYCSTLKSNLQRHVNAIHLKSEVRNNSVNLNRLEKKSINFESPIVTLKTGSL